MTCGCCQEACPQYDEDDYTGPQAIAQVRLFNMHPNGESPRDERLAAIMGDGRRLSFLSGCVQFFGSPLQISGTPGSEKYSG